MNRNPSWSRSKLAPGKLYFIILLFVGIGLLQFFVGKMQADVLYAVRAYVAGEGLWSKAQKDGVQNLQRYGGTRDEAYYRAFLRDMEVPLGDKNARLELLKDRPDPLIAHRGFIQGGNHPDDVDSLIWLFIHFRKVPHMAKAIEIWTEADGEIVRLMGLAEELHRAIANRETEEHSRRLLADLERLNNRLTYLENRFSSTLGEAARWVQKITLLFAFFTTTLLLACGAWLAWRIIRATRAAAEALAESEAKFRSAFSNAAVGMAMTAPDGRFLVTNRTMREMLGYEEEELLRLTFRDITHADDILADNAHVEALLSGACDHYVSEKRYIRKDGGILAAVVSVAVIRDAGRKAVYFIGQISDITARVKAEQQLQRAHSEQNAILENAIVGIALIRGRRIVWANQRFGDIVETPPDRLIGMGLDPFSTSPDSHWEFMDAAYATIGTGQSFTGEAAFRSVGGRHFWARIAGKAIDPVDAEQGSIWILEDVTERKKAETALIEAKETAEEATRLKDKFVSLVSHDLKGPLGAIKLGLGLVLEGDGSQLGRENRKVMEQAHITSQNLLHLIDELLSMGKLKTGKVKPEKVFLNAARFALRITEDFAAAAAKKGVHLAVNVPPSARLYADPALLAEVLANLVSNALKFTARGGAITVGVIVDGRAGLSVADTGKGIPQNRIEHLFSYEQKTSTPGTEGETGSGLGLPLCRDIMVAQGGEIALTSTPGEGTTFSMVLPAVQPVVLLVGANPGLAAKLEEALEAESITVRRAEDVLEANGILAREPIHLIAAKVEAVMPEGGNFVKALHAATGAKRPPVVLLTEGQLKTDKEKYHNLDAEGLVDIVEQLDDLVPCVKRFLG